MFEFFGIELKSVRRDFSTRYFRQEKKPTPNEAKVIGGKLLELNLNVQLYSPISVLWHFSFGDISVLGMFLFWCHLIFGEISFGDNSFRNVLCFCFYFLYIMYFLHLFVLCVLFDLVCTLCTFNLALKLLLCCAFLYMYIFYLLFVHLYCLQFI